MTSYHKIYCTTFRYVLNMAYDIVIPKQSRKHTYGKPLGRFSAPQTLSLLEIKSKGKGLNLGLCPNPPGAGRPWTANSDSQFFFVLNI